MGLLLGFGQTERSGRERQSRRARIQVDRGGIAGVKTASWPYRADACGFGGGPGAAGLFGEGLRERRLRNTDSQTSLPISDLAGRNEFVVSQIQDGDNGAVVGVIEVAKIQDIALAGNRRSFRRPKLTSHLDEQREDGPNFRESGQATRRQDSGGCRKADVADFYALRRRDASVAFADVEMSPFEHLAKFPGRGPNAGKAGPADFMGGGQVRYEGAFESPRQQRDIRGPRGDIKLDPLGHPKVAVLVNDDAHLDCIHFCASVLRVETTEKAPPFINVR